MDFCEGLNLHSFVFCCLLGMGMLLPFMHRLCGFIGDYWVRFTLFTHCPGIVMCVLSAEAEP